MIHTRQGYLVCIHKEQRRRPEILQTVASIEVTSTIAFHIEAVTNAPSYPSRREMAFNFTNLPYCAFYIPNCKNSPQLTHFLPKLYHLHYFLCSGQTFQLFLEETIIFVVSHCCECSCHSKNGWHFCNWPLPVRLVSRPPVLVPVRYCWNVKPGNTTFYHGQLANSTNSKLTDRRFF